MDIAEIRRDENPDAIARAIREQTSSTGLYVSARHQFPGPIPAICFNWQTAKGEFNNPCFSTCMNSDIGAIIVITTVPDENLAVKITETLLQRRLAACVHALPSGWSRYRWQGQIESAAEITLLIKSTSTCYRELESEILRLHPYDVPEIVAVPVSVGLQTYLDWIKSETD